MLNLTIAQRRVYRELIRFVDLHGYVPSVRELAAECQRAPSVVHVHLRNLESKGLVRRISGTARALVIKVVE